MSLDGREKFESVMTFIGSILGLITGFLYFGIGGAILGFLVGGIAFLFVAQFLNEFGEGLGCIFQIAVTFILIILLWGKFAPMNLFKSDHNDEKINPDGQKLQSQSTNSSENTRADSSKRLDSIRKSNKDKQSNSEVSSVEKPKKIDISSGIKSEQKPSPIKDAIDLSTIDYPTSFLTTADSQFLATDGKETVIPANTRILILKRTPTGMLSLEANGKTYLGYESRLIGNIKK
jgi:hypothetical protein